MSAGSRSFYLHLPRREPVFASFDVPAQDGVSTGVLLLPMFGNADLCAYRARRDWAKTLAAAGHPTLRIDLPGTGDSAGGPYDHGLLDSWDASIAAAAAWLRGDGGCTRVAAIGIALGGLLAYRAVCEGAAIDDLVLWSVPARGRTLLRQLRALARMEASQASWDQAHTGADPSPPKDALAVAGFVLSAETLTALAALDLSDLTLPEAQRRRVLLLDRDGLPVDSRLQATLERSGAEVTLAPGPGYGEMVAPPQQSRPPQEVFATVCDWLLHASADGAPLADEALADRAPLADGAPAGDAALMAEPRAMAEPRLMAGPAPAVEVRIATSDALDLNLDGRHIRETPLAIARGEGRLIGVLCEPESDGLPLCAVLLNAGALRRIGPNRMWVETARRWAARGVPTLRIDLAGIGDSDGDAAALEQDEGFYIPRYIAQTHEVLHALAAQGMPRRFVLVGLCSGAYWAFHAALEDERVRGAFMINPRALFWDWSIGGVREARNLRKALRPETWRKLAGGQITGERMRTIAQGARIALASLPTRMRTRRRRLEGEDELGRALTRLGESQTQLLAVFTDDEPVYDELVRDGDLERMRALPNVRVESIPGPITSHTLEPILLQDAVHELLDAALERVVEAMEGANAGHDRAPVSGGAAQL